jgi:phosphatidylglycerophosphate synthase
MATLGARASVAVHRLGKFKTAAQMIAIPLLLLDQRTLGGWFDAHWWGARLIEVAAVLTVWSMMYYLKQAWPIIKERG